MNVHTITYRFHFADGRIYEHSVSLNEETLTDESPLNDPLPSWTELGCRKCAHCPLDSESSPHCPFAARLAPLLSAFAPVNSYDGLTLEVDDGRRHLHQPTTAQQAVSSLLGLLCATSGCPYGAPFRPLARFHLPLASPDETLFRIVGAQLIRHFLGNGQVSAGDLEGLNDIYDDIHRVNIGMAKRLRGAAETDAAVNAIVLLDTLAGHVPNSLDDALMELRRLFKDPEQLPQALA